MPLRLVKRASVVAATVTIGLLVSMTPAFAATSHGYAYHWWGTRLPAGEVWFNSGTHNMSKGRNSFTVKDLMCGDGWAIFVRFRRQSNPTFISSAAVTCQEFSFSVAGDVPREVIYWMPCKTPLSDLYNTVECDGVYTDYVD